MLNRWDRCVGRPVEIGGRKQHVWIARKCLDGWPERELLEADQYAGATIPNADGWREAKHQRVSNALVPDVPHTKRHRHTLSVRQSLRIATGEENIAIGFRVRDRDCGADQQAGAL